MSYCVNPDCPQPKNPIDAFLCQACGARLLVRNRYRVTKSLGQGGFGATFVAIDVSLPGEPICVIKQLRPSNNHEKFLRMARELFEREARTLGKIGNHPQIPRLLDFFEERRNFYLVQEYVSGHTIHQEVKQTGLFKEEKIRDFLIEILPVITYIHSQQVIHRDIKPANILRRDQDGKLVLIDFGAVKNYVAQMEVPEGVEQGSNTQFAVGTSGYAPPEQLAMRPIFASDIYALGVTCVYLMTGKSPKDIEYNPSTGEMMWQKHVQLGKHMTQVLGKMLEVSVRYRYQSVEEVQQALASTAVAVETRAPRVPTPPVGSPSKPLPIDKAGVRPGLPQNPNNPPQNAQNTASSSASQRIAEKIREQRLERDPTNIKNAGDRSQIGADLRTGFGGVPAIPVPREQLKLDAQGVLAAFRRGQRTFSEMDISSLDLAKAHLPGITLSSANCAYINLQGANLAAGKFDKADLSGAVLKDTVLSKGYFSYANLQNADLRGADLSDAYLNYANLHGANLCGANLKGVKVTEDQLNQAKTNFMTVFPNGKRGGFW
ncbi:serine/threonine-protein kinase [Chamaesiphon minutus]|uniref:Serine/threonine-protein kinase B n=1 Tax=Chamaesiphon minutus (strain ATCC 27169 / PCC 6605) TaxID=1173020 RepID=K9UP12_CHAP6|nr:serine/threonine-protein kinase [Chamaesiphon minutus]AFY95929.1 serine/threonine protein kinase [Chamaesiphon minutus PCC 6605]